MAYVPVPKDLSKIKTKLAFNLTKRQLICFSAAASVGLPTYLLTRGALGNSAAMLLMIGLMLPFFFFAMYEKDGQPLEVIANHFIQAKFVRPKIRPYQTDNYYDVLLRQYQLEREVEQIVFQKENKGKRNKNAQSSQPKTAERNQGCD